jgi:hypothetical protein
MVFIKIGFHWLSPSGFSRTRPNLQGTRECLSLNFDHHSSLPKRGPYKRAEAAENSN